MPSDAAPFLRALCQRPEIRCARSHVFRPLDDRFVRGLAQRPGRWINGAIFRDLDDSMA